MKLGIMGGSYNPVHIGHLFLADNALTQLNLDRIVMIPAYRSPFKTDAEGMETSAGDRLLMLAAAASGDSGLAVDDCEILREGVSYTVDTLEDIISRYMPSGKPVLIIGSDLASDFPKWHNSEEILQMADIAIGNRLNLSGSENPSINNNYPYPHLKINNDIINISSQKVRQRIKDGKDWRSLVPAGAREIIIDKNLYGCNINGQDNFQNGVSVKLNNSYSMIMQIETAVRQTISMKRFLHSKNTALLAYDLCRRFDVDPAAGYLAGIAHDICKEMDTKQMMELALTDGKIISDLEKKKPGLLHGRAGAVLLKNRFCINNKDVLEAVAVHTSGSENMSRLAKIIYIADKAEVSRNIGPEYRKMCRDDSLDNILIAILKKTVSKLQTGKLDLSEDTRRLLARMKIVSR